MYGNPYGYPFMGAQMVQNNPFLPQVSQPTQPQNDGPVVLYAPTAKEFANVSVQPGRQALVISQNDPYIAFKTADAMGKVNTTLYRLEAVTPDQINGPAVEYATKNELAQLQGVVQQLVENMSKPARAKKEATE